MIRVRSTIWLKWKNLVSIFGGILLKFPLNIDLKNWSKIGKENSIMAMM